MAGAGIARNKPNVPDPLSVQTLTATQRFILAGISAAINVAASQDNWAPAELAANTMLLVNPTAPVTITGLDSTGLSNGALVGFRNVHPTNALTCTNADGQSLGINQFTTPGLVSAVVQPGDAIVWQYNSTSQKFEVFAFGTQGGAGGEANLGANVGGGTGLVFRDKTGVTLNFKTLVQGANITLTNNADTIQIDASAGSGTANLNWNFSSNTTAADPASGNFRLDNADRTLVAEIYISQDTAPGLDATKLIEALGLDDEIYIQQVNDADAAALYSATGAAVDNGAWFTIPVVFASQDTNAFVDTENCGLLFAYNGAAAGGQNNTASNVGTGAAEVFKQKSGVNLEMRTGKSGIGIDARTDTNEFYFNNLGASYFPSVQFSYLWDAGSFGLIPQLTAIPVAQDVLNIGPKGTKWAQSGELDAAPLVMNVTPQSVAPDGPGIDNAHQYTPAFVAPCAWQHPNIDFTVLTDFTIFAGWCRPKYYSVDLGTVRQWIFRQGDNGANTNMISIEAVSVYTAPGSQATTIEAKVNLNTGQEVLAYPLPDARAWYCIEIRVSLTLIELVVNGTVVDSVTPAAASYAITTTATNYTEFFGSALGTGGDQFYGNYGRYHGISEHYWTDAESLAAFNYREGPIVTKNGPVLNWWYNTAATEDTLGGDQRSYKCILGIGPAGVTKLTTAFHNRGFAGKYQCEFLVEGTGNLTRLRIGGANDNASEVTEPGFDTESSGLDFEFGDVYFNNAIVGALAGGAILLGETIVFRSDILANGNVTETWLRYSAARVLLDQFSHTHNAFTNANAERYGPCVGRRTAIVSATIRCRFAPRDLTFPLAEGFEAWTSGGEGQGIVPAPRGFKEPLYFEAWLDAPQTTAAAFTGKILFDTARAGNFPPGSLDIITGEVTIPPGVRGATLQAGFVTIIELEDTEKLTSSAFHEFPAVFGGNIIAASSSNAASAAVSPAKVNIGASGVGQIENVSSGDKFFVIISHNAGAPRDLQVGCLMTLLLLDD